MSYYHETSKQFRNFDISKSGDYKDFERRQTIPSLQMRRILSGV